MVEIWSWTKAVVQSFRNLVVIGGGVFFSSSMHDMIRTVDDRNPAPDKSGEWFPWGCIHPSWLKDGWKTSFFSEWLPFKVYVRFCDVFSLFVENQTDKWRSIQQIKKGAGNHQIIFLTLFSFRLHDILKWYTNGARHGRRRQRLLYALMLWNDW